MADIVKTIGAVQYEFKETNQDAQWELEQEVHDNKYKMTLCKFGESWCGTVDIKLNSGATMNFTQKDVPSHEILIRRLIDHTVRCQELLVPQPKQL